MEESEEASADDQADDDEDEDFGSRSRSRPRSASRSGSRQPSGRASAVRSERSCTGTTVLMHLPMRPVSCSSFVVCCSQYCNTHCEHSLHFLLPVVSSAKCISQCIAKRKPTRSAKKSYEPMRRLQALLLTRSPHADMQTEQCSSVC